MIMEAQDLATDIVRKLTQAGYIAYFAGGWVRDYLMGHPSEDIDIATDAPPNIILDLFPHTILVGLAFGVIVVVVDGHQFEVATFRRDIDYADGRKPSQIELAKPEEDASRRDFTINGMFYDPLEGVIHDFVHGKEDIEKGIIRTIGDPYERFVEDRLRMLRAVRFASRFNFQIDWDTHEAIRASADTLFPAVAMERIWQEFSKMSQYPRFDSALIDAHRLGLLPVIFPALAGLHLNDLKKRVEPFEHYAPKTPTIIYLMALFPEATKVEALELCRYLRTSMANANIAEFLVHVREVVRKEAADGVCERTAWTHIYANPEGRRCVQAIAAYLPVAERKEFLKKHSELAIFLDRHIQRVSEKKPLVTSSLLIEEGISPGKSMGLLLKEAERIAIENDLNHAQEVMIVLKKTNLWLRREDVKASG